MDGFRTQNGSEFNKGHQASAMSLPVKTRQKPSAYKKFFPIMTLFVMVVRLLCVVDSEHIVVGQVVHCVNLSILRQG